MDIVVIEEIFHLIDDKDNLEVPGGWDEYDYENAYLRALELKQRIERFVGDSCYMNSKYSVEKASYLVDIELPVSVLVSENEDAKIRISNFGSMLTIIGNKLHDSLSISEDFREGVLSMIDEMEFKLIPNECLWIKYPKDKRFSRRKFKNWGHRYFEFIK